MTRYINPRNSLADRVRRAAHRLEAEGRIAPRVLTSPAGSYTRAPSDILVEIERDGARRTQEQALEIAKRRDPEARFKRRLVRYYVFAGGGE